MLSWRLAVLASLLAVALPLAVIWVPELRHYYVRPVSVSPALALELTRQIPQNVCREFAFFEFSPLPGQVSPEEWERAQRAALRGELAMPRLPPVRFDPDFSGADFEFAASPAALDVAMLIVLKLLVSEYEQTGNPQALQLARSYFRGWWHFERRSIWPTGFQWNDHAVAGRIYALTRYLCAASRRDDFSPADANEIVSALLTSGARLLKPGYFTFRTNHGVMQNLALLHLAAMFPSLPQAKEYVRIAASRLTEQFDFYLSEEGVILEHSAGYHAFGVNLLSIAARYLQALGEPLPPRLIEAYPAAIRFLAQLRRPDGTVPAWGNTQYRTGHPRIARDKSLAGDIALSLETNECELPHAQYAFASGVAIWWDSASRIDCGRNRSEQALLVWSNFPSQAHKHIDEMSVFLWVRGYNLTTGSGYWPYNSPQNQVAVGWASGNGPRFLQEREADRGETVPVSSASSDTAEFLELERRSVNGRLRRQVLYLRRHGWLIIDSADTQGTSFEFHFTFDPRLQPQPLPQSDSHALALLHGDKAVALVYSLECMRGNAHILRGSKDPFIGWTSANSIVEPTYALLRQCPGDAPSMVWIDISGRSAPLWLPQTTADRDDRWTFKVGDLRISRMGEQILVHRGDSRPFVEELTLARPTGHLSAKEQLDRSYMRTSSRYDRYVESWRPWRVRASNLILLSFCAQSLLLATVAATVRRNLRLQQRLLEFFGTLGTLAWASLAVWLSAFYFVR